MTTTTKTTRTRSFRSTLKAIWRDQTAASEALLRFDPERY